LKVIIKLGKLLAHLRAVVTWEYTQGIDYAYATAIIEEPDRAIEQLRNIARGHALSLGRNYITLDDLVIPIKVVLSTASIERVNVFDLLVANKGRLSTTIINDSFNLTTPTSLKTMRELKAVGLVDFVKEANENEEKEIELKQDFNWFLGDEFSKLRDNFEPADNSEYLRKGKKKPRDADDDADSLLKEKNPPCTHKNDNDKLHKEKITSPSLKLNNNTNEDEIKPVGATYVCKYCNEEQYSYYWELHKKSCIGRK
jgi:hypothetical protein